MEADTERIFIPRRISLRRTGWILLGVTLAINVASMAVPALIDHPLTTNRGEIHDYLDVFVEGNLPTWWSTGLLVIAAASHAMVGAIGQAARVKGSWAWFASAAMLGALSLDDHTQLHERLDRIGRHLVTYDGGFPFYWLLPGLVAGLIVAIGLLLLARHLHGRARWHMIVGCVLLLAAALGGEALQGLLIASGESGPLYVLTYHAEELGENLGVLAMLAAAAHSVWITRTQHSLEIAYTKL
ncbi:hypothetical protein [Kibdelosporangium aridum]|uniref:hypothetical protein n=1 Tax=Kibdelosporangium aridum TaxID=2030 RepID=UPI000B248880|nr:hypothetical protein [Kibdelosporangium aridum]